MVHALQRGDPLESRSFGASGGCVGAQDPGVTVSRSDVESARPLILSIGARRVVVVGLAAAMGQACAAITKTEVVSPLAGFGTRSYSVGGANTVKITWQAGTRTRSLLVGTNDAQGLMSAIERARGAPPVQVRVAALEAESLEAESPDVSEAADEAQHATRTKR